jgi:hypothetical protein
MELSIEQNRGCCVAAFPLYHLPHLLAGFPTFSPGTTTPGNLRRVSEALSNGIWGKHPIEFLNQFCKNAPHAVLNRWLI